MMNVEIYKASTYLSMIRNTTLVLVQDYIQEEIIRVIGRIPGITGAENVNDLVVEQNITSGIFHKQI
jgi:hypothetical protein